MGIAALLIFFLLYLFVLRKRGKCGKCGTVLPKGARQCGACGEAVGPSGAPSGEMGITAMLAPSEGETLAAPSPAHGASVPTSCPSCGEDVPAGEEWCPACGALATSQAGAGEPCPECGALMATPAGCDNCGYTLAEIPALVPERDMTRGETGCPRCYASVAPGAKRCAVCGGDIERLLDIQRAKMEKGEKGAVPPAPPGSAPAQPPPVPGGAVCECGTTLAPGAKWCDVCGKKV